ncbi:hypothetical protein [Burkholderia diffusa]|uniref:hypothetical protein n=1 Tax=Burkholderia diffusa TaxID=488732 RepID=UPI000A9A94B3|nr:hypothetical protein [Burkholderia diffusa]
MNSFIDRVTSVFKKDTSANDKPLPVSPPEPTPMALAPQWALLPPQTDEQKLARFATELESALHSLDHAVAQNANARKDLDQLKDTLDDRGWWGAFKASFNGQTDKELAGNVEMLGHSLEITQKVVRVMLQVQTQKGRLLNAFSDALVGKIADIQTDTQTLDGNQRSTALAFLEELHQQVQEQIRQQDLIEQHDNKLHDLAQWQFEKYNQDAALAQQLEQQRKSREQWQELKDLRDADTAKELQTVKSSAEAMKQAVASLNQWRDAKHREDDELRTQMVQIEQEGIQQFSRMSDSVAAIAATQARQESLAQAIHERLDTLLTRVAELERLQSQAKSLSAALLRHGPPLVALAIAVAALIKALSA